MAYDVSALVDFIAADPIEVLTDIIMSGRSFSILRIEDGIKSEEKRLDIGDTSVTLQQGDYTGIAGHVGGAVLNEILLSVEETWIKEKYTSRELQKKITGLAMRQGTNPDDLALKDILMDLKGRQLNLVNEILLWQGDTGGAGNLSLFDGFIKQIVDSADKKKTGSAAVALTSGNAITQVNLMVSTMKANYPEWVESEVMLDNYMSVSNFDTYYQAIFNLNGVINNDTIQKPVIKDLLIPGTNVTARAMSGIEGTHEMILTRPDNLIINTDLVSETDQIEFEYHKLVRWFELFVLYKLGAKVARTRECILMAA